MSYTNTTEHYNLPQYIGTDKPTYLGDMNSAYRVIDAKLYEANTNATAASKVASDASQMATSANQTAQGNLTNISLANTNIALLEQKFKDNKITIESRGFSINSNNSEIRIESGADYSPYILQINKINIPNVGKLYYLYCGAAIAYPNNYTASDVIKALTIPGVYNFIEEREGGVAFTASMQFNLPSKDTDTQPAVYHSYDLTITKNGNDGMIMGTALSTSVKTASTRGYIIANKSVFVPA